MTQNFRSYNDLVCTTVMEELVRLGVRDVFIAPGSRSTPLVFAAEENSNLSKHVHFDERGLSFWALGCAKKSKRPVVLITTSGSAAANLYPAIIEAGLTEIPLLVFTADRPFELRSNGANQAIDQVEMFNHILEFHDMPVPSPYLPLESVLTTIDHVVRLAGSIRGGPVQLNWMFQEPLAPPLDENIDYKPNDKIKKWRAAGQPFTHDVPEEIASLVPDSIKTLVRDARDGLIVVGAQGDVGLTDENFKNLTWPVFFDVQSSLRLQNIEASVSQWDLLLELKKDYRPDVVILLGGAVTSRKGLEFMKDLSCPVIQVHPFGKRMDPHHLAKVKIAANGAGILKCVAEAKKAKSYDGLLTGNSQIKKSLENQLQDRFNEPAIAYQVTKKFTGENLFFASSRPIRDVQRYGQERDEVRHIFTNRGASGIDGNLATVAGIALGSSPGETTLGFLGDLASLHDLNSLALISKSKNPILVVVVNNDGGGIFSFLPVAQHREVFEKYWGTPHGYDFEHFAQGFHLQYKKAESAAELNDILSNFGKHAKSGQGNLLVEIKSSRQGNLAEHQKILEVLKRQTTL